jgi:hypothetical protein
MQNFKIRKKDEMEKIKKNVEEILSEIPEGIQLVAATKTRTPEEILAAIDAGIKIIGENYVQEALKKFEVIGNKAKWHLIGHLQRNKVKYAINIFDMIETVDSAMLAQAINNEAKKHNKVMPILIEINSGREPQKTGVLPEAAEQLVRQIAPLPNIKLLGLMTMGPFTGDPEDARPYFKTTRNLFEKLKHIQVTNVEMRHLSMGMSNSYKIAIEEGANIVRIGTKIFGERKYSS